jgi:hypothetical protein
MLGGLGFPIAGCSCVVVEVVLVEVELELDVDEFVLLLEPEPEPEPELDELPELGLPAGGHDSDVLATGPGRLSDDSGAPGGSWKYSVCPLARTTVTVQLAAEAAGSATTPHRAKTAPAASTATFSFGRVNTGALSPPALRDAANVHA